MRANYNKTGAERKELVNAIAEITGQGPKYMRMPTCAYEIGDITIDKDGGVSCEDEEELKKVMEALKEKGFTAEDEPDIVKSTEAEQPEQEPDEQTEAPAENQMADEKPSLTISLPVDCANIGTLLNLISAKDSLIKKALGVTDTSIHFTDEKVEFPWFDRELTPEETKAYTIFIAQLCKLSKELKHASSKPVETDNEKYAMRTWLLRMGFIGPDFKEVRKVLLKNLSGSSAFRNGAPKKEAAENEEAVE